MQRLQSDRHGSRVASLLCVIWWMLPLMTHAETQPNRVQITRNFNATPEKVWQTWTEPAWVSRWFGSNTGGHVLDAQLDVRPGGHFSVTFTDADGTEHTCSGDYIDVQPYRKLSFTWQWKSEPGVQTLVTITFAPENDGTRMEFEHSQLFVASTHDYASGWQSTFDKLELVLTQDTASVPSSHRE